ncbi:hypothetical protein F4055_06020 [Candidatus Poribacteria bacterium]|nr:hypothetical protein [Candidatus Poribacteria bacterium]
MTSAKQEDSRCDQTFVNFSCELGVLGAGVGIVFEFDCTEQEAADVAFIKGIGLQQRHLWIIVDFVACELEDEFHGFDVVLEFLFGFGVRVECWEFLKEVVDGAREFEGAFALVTEGR